MTPLAFLRSAAAQHLLARASRSAGMPVSAHFVGPDGEGPKLAGEGGCETCRFVNGLPEGKKACAKSRIKAARAAMNRGRPVPFICHMGFPCVAVPVLPEEVSGLVLTFGPYCPAEAPGSLERDAYDRLRELDVEMYPGFSLNFEDIRLCSGGSAPEVASWTAELLSGLWRREGEHASETDELESESVTPAGRRGVNRPVGLDPYQAADIVAALIARNRTQARALLQAALEESPVVARRRSGANSARVIGVVAAAIEAAARANKNVDGCLERFEGFVREVRAAANDQERVDAAMDALTPLTRERSSADQTNTRMAALNRILIERMGDGVTLSEAAAELGVTPPAISHYLKRRFNMSFTQYLGRLRVDKAKELLRRTKLSVTAIAQRAGVPDTSNFGKLFIKFERITPAQYRQRFGKK